MNIYFLYLTCSLRFLSRRKKKEKTRKKHKNKDEKLYSWKKIFIYEMIYNI